jgi:V/A-type H+-transporting ATPase subunit A
VTEATKKAAKCFYALSQSRADSKRYPAIDPLESYSKYLEYDEMVAYLNHSYGEEWTTRIAAAKTMIQRGKEAFEQINILGDDGVPVEYHDLYWKSELFDFTFLQQDSFDAVDAHCSMERQVFMFDFLMAICTQAFTFEHFEACQAYYKGLINEIRQMNYAAFDSPEFTAHKTAVDVLLAQQQA